MNSAGGATLDQIEERLAANIIDRHERTGAKIAYWGADGHTVVGDQRALSLPPGLPIVGRSAGSWLRDRLGRAYASIGLTFDHGSVRYGPTPFEVPPPGNDFTDSLLSEHGRLLSELGRDFLLDLRAEPAPAVRRWLQAPAKLRLIGPDYRIEDDAAGFLSGGTLADWFDLLIHQERVTPAQPVTTTSTPASRSASARAAGGS